MPETAEKTDPKADADAKKADAEAAKKAEEQAKQDEADVETFASFHRGEALVRGEVGSLDLPRFLEQRKAAKEAEEADKDDKK
jgi:hypothetical protein